MNKDKKIALVLAPFLLVAGYVLSDMYLASDDEVRLYPLESATECLMFSADCILLSGDMQVNLTDRDGITHANVNFPVDRVALSLVYDDGQEVIYGLDQLQNAHYWSRATEIRKAFIDERRGSSLRLVVTLNNSQYFSEFKPGSRAQ